MAESASWGGKGACFSPGHRIPDQLADAKLCHPESEEGSGELKVTYPWMPSHVQACSCACPSRQWGGQYILSLAPDLSGHGRWHPLATGPLLTGLWGGCSWGGIDQTWPVVFSRVESDCPVWFQIPESPWVHQFLERELGGICFRLQGKRGCVAAGQIDRWPTFHRQVPLHTTFWNLGEIKM